MNPRLSYYLMIGMLVLVGTGIIGSAVFGDHLLQQQTNKLVALKLNSKVLDEQQSALIQANKDIVKYADLEKIAKTIVPQDKDQARVVREIVGYANDTSIPVQNISFPTSNLGQSAVGSASGTTTTPAPTKSLTSQLKAVEGLSGVYEMDVTVQSDTTKPVPFSKIVDFLKKLENNRRTAQVSSITITPDAQNRQLLTFSIIVNVYVKP